MMWRIRVVAGVEVEGRAEHRGMVVCREARKHGCMMMSGVGGEVCRIAPRGICMGIPIIE